MELFFRFWFSVEKSEPYEMYVNGKQHGIPIFILAKKI